MLRRLRLQTAPGGMARRTMKRYGHEKQSGYLFMVPPAAPSGMARDDVPKHVVSSKWRAVFQAPTCAYH